MIEDTWYTTPGCPFVCRHDKVVAIADEVEAKTDGGILLPEQAVKHMDRTGGTATVLGVSPLGWIDDLGKRHITDLRPGDRIVTVAHGGMWIKYQGKKYMFIAEKDILATVVEV